MRSMKGSWKLSAITSENLLLAVWAGSWLSRARTVHTAMVLRSMGSPGHSMPSAHWVPSKTPPSASAFTASL